MSGRGLVALWFATACEEEQWARLSTIPKRPVSSPNTYRSDIGVYLANALVPASDRVMVAAQRRDIDQRDLVIDYMLIGQPAPAARRGLTVACG